MIDGTGPRRRVLLAEDHPLNQRVATLMLEQLGFRVDVVADGAEAVRAATRTAYHAIFMDCQIPVLDGYRATAAIRLHKGPSCRAPIIAVTASGAESNRQRCLDAGMDDRLMKPLSMRTLAAVLARCTPDRSVDAREVSKASDVASSVDGPERPVLDASVVAGLERLGEAAGQDLLGQLAALFLADADERVVTLRQAADRGDAAAFAAAAHALGGSSANVGATELANLCNELCTELSADGEAGGLVGAGARLDAIAVELARVRAVLDPSVLTS
jgi:CheY-like chemotaxis protein/HPt (histidine-containing phosphotransfer) domain-containing protein